MTAVRWTDALPALRSPILVTAFEGWFDRQTPGAISSSFVHKPRRMPWSER